MGRLGASIRPVYRGQGNGRRVSYIRVIDEDEAEDDLFSIYDKVQKSRGRLSNILRIQSLHPRALQRHLDLYMELLFGKGPLSRKQRELIAVVVSSTGGCGYCVTHHAEALDKYAKDPEWVRAVAKDFTQVDLEPEERALADFAKGLTLHPDTGREEAVAALREAGFDDEAILHATELVAYFNFVNRIASGLGVDLESEEKRDYDY